MTNTYGALFGFGWVGAGQVGGGRYYYGGPAIPALGAGPAGVEQQPAEGLAGEPQAALPSAAPPARHLQRLPGPDCHVTLCRAEREEPRW
eukprot:6935534-Pyramimonas_sp.AAC.1